MRREIRSDRLDVADRAAVASYAEAVAGQFGRVNVVVNNAGVALAGDVEDLAWSDMEWIMGINFWGVVHGTKEFLPHLIASGDGHVVNMSSLFGLVSMPGQSMYNAAKYAVRGFTEALREEMLVAGHPVRVTAVHPGGVKTAIARNGRYSDREDATESARIFDEKMATMEPERAARDHRREGHPRRQGAAAGRPRRPRGPPPRAALGLALPGRRRPGRREAPAPEAVTDPAPMDPR